MIKKNAGIYVHIPFCVKKCKYCDFLSGVGNENVFREYTDAVTREIESYCETAKNYKISTIYFGGGTPTVLPILYIEKIVAAINEIFDTGAVTEFTVEGNPGTITFDRVLGLRSLGVNRMSIGIQSAIERELQLLGRIHTFKDSEECVKNIYDAGIMNVSVDVMFSLPKQTEEDCFYTIDKIVSLNPKHISAYSLMVEEGTEFYKLYSEKGPLYKDLPDEITDRKMYKGISERLKKAGFMRYEISNFARPGYESRHNSSYWTGTEYIGLGAGAASLINNVRYSNVRDVKKYIENPVNHITEEILTKKSLMSEYMILGLRMTRGISISGFKEKFGVTIDDVFGAEINKSVSEKTLVREGDMLSLTDYGIDVSNVIFERFYI